MRALLHTFYQCFNTTGFRLALLLCLTTLLFTGTLQAQTPFIQSFSPTKAFYGKTITLNGSGFAATADLKVKFGSVAAEIIESASTYIKVKVPAGASYAPISVTNLSSGLIAYTAQPFLLSFGGIENGAVAFAPSVSFAGSGVFDVCACDLDGDGRNDMIGSNENSTTINAFLNSSSIGNVSFPVRKDIAIGSRSLYVSCGDLDGDGKADLVYTGTATEGSKVTILRNTSTTGSISFAAPQVVSLENKLFAKPAIRDLDGDGRAELVFTDKAQDQLIVFRNTSSIGSIGFDATPLSLPVSEASTHGLRIKDVNQDGLADITASNLFGSKIFIFLNSSTKGNLNFQAPLEFAGTNLYNHELEDLDSDGLPDLITLDYFNNGVNVQLNTGTNGSISFSAPISFASGTRPNGLELGDLNGDKKVDILIGHNQDAQPLLLINTSTPGLLSFKTNRLSGAGSMPNIQIVDVDGDAKPDVMAADRSNGVFYVFRNQSCIYPHIRPNGTVELCEGSTVTLSTVQSPLAEMAEPQMSYQWLKDGVAVGNGHSIEVSSPGTYAVNMSSSDGCSASSEVVSVQSFKENLGNPVFDPVSNACEGQPLQLSVSPASEGVTYTWTNDLGFQESSSSNSITIPAADPSLHDGTYTVSIAKGPCQLILQSEVVSIKPAPIVNISADGPLAICSGESRTLSLAEGYAAYQWKKDGNNIANATTASLSVSEAGAYTLVVKNDHGCETESDALSISVTEELKAAFEAPALACVDQPVQFTDQSTLSTGKTAQYLWDFGDGSQSTEQSPQHTYTQSSSTPYTVTLKVQYQNSSCSSTFSRQITVHNTSGISLEALGATTFCAGDSVKVQVNGDVREVKWSNGTSGLFTYAKESGGLSAEIITPAGCSLTKSIDFTLMPAPQLQLSADKTRISIGESVQLQADGGISYSWEPAESLDVPTSANPIASPSETTTYTVTAWGENGCTAVGEITVEVDFSFIVKVPKLFIPSTDQYWKIENIEYYPDVSLVIMNKFGKIFFTAAAYQNNWTADGLTEGVYFYAFKDAEGKILKSGSVTLIR